MSPFARRTTVDPELRELLGRRRVLASGRSPAGQVLGVVNALIYVDETAARELYWHQVERGGWSKENSALHWTTISGESCELPLMDPGALPELFNERVTASIALTRTISLQESGTAIVTARRDLADHDSALIWHVTPGPNTAAAQVAGDPSVLAEVARIRAEYDAG